VPTVSRHDTNWDHKKHANPTAFHLNYVTENVETNQMESNCEQTPKVCRLPTTQLNAQYPIDDPTIFVHQASTLSDNTDALAKLVHENNHNTTKDVAIMTPIPVTNFASQMKEIEQDLAPASSRKSKHAATTLFFVSR
jgi:hypothetical protein